MHEAAMGIFRISDDRLAANVEAGVDDHRASGLLFERSQDPMKTRIPFAIDGLAYFMALRIADVEA